MDNEKNLKFSEENEERNEPLRPEDILDEMENIITSGRQILLSNRVTIDPDEFLELIDCLRDTLPPSIRRAEEIISNSENILSEAEVRAGAILENAHQRAEELTSAAVPYNVRSEAKKLLERAICLAEQEQK